MDYIQEFENQGISDVLNVIPSMVAIFVARNSHLLLTRAVSLGPNRFIDIALMDIIVNKIKGMESRRNKFLLDSEKDWRFNNIVTWMSLGYHDTYFFTSYIFFEKSRT